MSSFLFAMNRDRETPIRIKSKSEKVVLFHCASACTRCVRCPLFIEEDIIHNNNDNQIGLL